ncbi:MAG: hypothetical protein E7B53_14295 [Clostridium sp.]|uniref:hypothetical protein n=1 Tax=Clostridium sp. TaxID=1506 RepID=UPI002902776D|nr:hypothetical protein [Clostridium sp.]MDU2895709.1 hypothetical protein [Clostridium sp.]MDU3008101.1 hypothetical protein [Clostridium sp.]MDU3052934.1 hypothetical protein [Clostridium sp.]
MSEIAQLEKDLISQRKMKKTDVINILCDRDYKITDIAKKSQLSKCSTYIVLDERMV